jgi:hypothetical protein
MNITWNRLFGSLLLFGFFASLGGCGKGYDETPPVVNGVDVSLNEIVPTVPGGILSFEIAFSDDQELNQAIISIKPADVDGFYSWKEGDWSSFTLFDLSGTSASQVFTVQAPDTVRGKHLVSINAIDARGNESESFEFMVDVQNGLLPYIEVLTINGQSTFPIEVTAGEAIVLEGSIAGNGGLSDYSVMVNDSLILSANPFSDGIDLTWYPLSVPAVYSGSGVLTISATNSFSTSTRTFSLSID